jgi:hypothetical protein
MTHDGQSLQQTTLLGISVIETVIDNLILDCRCLKQTAYLGEL